NAPTAQQSKKALGLARGPYKIGQSPNLRDCKNAANSHPNIERGREPYRIMEMKTPPENNEIDSKEQKTCHLQIAQAYLVTGPDVWRDNESRHHGDTDVGVRKLVPGEVRQEYGVAGNTR